MSKKSELRYRIDTLIKCAKTTTNDILREEWLIESANLLDELEESELEKIYFSPVECWIKEYAIITDGKRGNRTLRREFYNYYIFCRKHDPRFPYLSRQAFNAELKQLNVATGKSGGNIWVGAIIRKENKE